ncbi:MAG: hypothetical protein DRP87_00190 [Spirochaetes bacterium]|nr:MAG: hypothetical protein DRP87_00190 [Spirochaetota bacterium]
MAKTPPEKYEPGELQRTRERLGDISPEEARRIASALGGEVGIEKTDPRIQEKYSRLEELRKKSDYTKYTRKREEAKQPESKKSLTPEAKGKSRSKITPTPSAEITAERKKTSFWDRIRMDFLAAKPEHQLKRKRDAFASILSFAFSVPDKVNPFFIKNGDNIFFKHIENLVFSIRGLININNKATVHRLKPGLYQKILDVIRDWDIEALHLELSSLQSSPSRISFTSLSGLSGGIYRPIVRLMDLDPHLHIGKAIKTIAELDILSVPKNSPIQQKIRTFFVTAREEIIPVFVEIKFRCYPLLLKLISNKFFPYQQFFYDMRWEILDFLKLKPEDVITPAPSSDTTSDKEKVKSEEGSSAETGAAKTTEEEAESEAAVSAPPEGADEIQKGLAILEKLFPGAGWNKLDEFPDLFSYFHPLFDFPRGIELIPPADPLHQVVILVFVLQEFFYGFRSLRFGTMENEKGDRIQIQTTAERIIGSWHYFHDEILTKHYTSLLNEYCRQIERNTQFKNTDYGRKIASDLMWIKRLYYLNLLKFYAVKGSRPALGPHLPKLFESTAELKELLQRIVQELDEAVTIGRKIESIENPRDLVNFEIENPVSSRLTSVFSSSGRTFTNSDLIRYTYAVLCVLDYLIGNPGSHTYSVNAEDPVRLFRSVGGRGEIPLYSVELKDPIAVIRKREAKKDKVTGFFTVGALKYYIQSAIRQYRKNRSPFFLLCIKIKGFSLYQEKAGKEAGTGLIRKIALTILQRIYDPMDIPFRLEESIFVVLLHRQNRSELIELAGLLADDLSLIGVKDGPSNESISFLFSAFEYRNNMAFEDIMKEIAQYIKEAAKHPPFTLILFDPEGEDLFPVPLSSQSP